MQRSTGPSRSSELSLSLHRQLNSYALAASAAGVSLLALAKPAEAEIVYTPAHHMIGPNDTYLLDLNHDGKTDFALVNKSYATTSGHYAALVVEPASSNEVGIYVANNHLVASALQLGVQLPDGHEFHASARMAYQCSGFACRSLTFASIRSGPWFGVSNRFLDLKFRVDGLPYYGWARLSVQFSANSRTFVATLTGYAYNTEPGRPIYAGTVPAPASFTQPSHRPATLGLLAMGSYGLSIWRREESDN